MNKQELFNTLMEKEVLPSDCNISDYTKSELTEMMYKKEEPTIVAEVVAKEESSVVVAEKKEQDHIVLDELDLIVKRGPFVIEDSFKPIYRINTHKRGTQPEIKISPAVFSYIESGISLHDIKDTNFERELKSIAFYCMNRKERCIMVTFSPNVPAAQVRIVNDELVSLR